MISLNHIKMSFDDVTLLNDITFNVKKGERVALVGPGGCGKSTILKILLGLLEPDRGEIFIMGEDIRAASEDVKREILKSVGMAFQQGALFDFMTVADNLKFAMDNMTTKTEEEKQARIIELLEGVKLGRTIEQYPFELSGGMQRRVGIARALCTDPVVAIFDEPTSGLDPVTSTIILNMIHDLGGDNAQDKAQMVVTSNVEIGIRFAERLIVVNEGTVVADGPWKDLLLNADDWVKNFLGVRFIGLDLSYAQELNLPQEFIDMHW